MGVGLWGRVREGTVVARRVLSLRSPAGPRLVGPGRHASVVLKEREALRSPRSMPLSTRTSEPRPSSSRYASAAPAPPASASAPAAPAVPAASAAAASARCAPAAPPSMLDGKAAAAAGSLPCQRVRA